MCTNLGQSIKEFAAVVSCGCLMRKGNFCIWRESCREATKQESRSNSFIFIR